MTAHRALTGPARTVLAPIQREFDRLFDQLGAGWSSLGEVELAPRMDVRDTKEGLEITLELPGIDQADVKIAVEDDLLTISGEKKTEKETKAEDYRLSERSYGSFSRSISLPRTVDPAKIQATMKHGVLKLTAPKNGSAQPKTIEIRPAE